jgi:hypothetical protein
VPLEDEVVPLAPEMLLADVQIRAFAPRRWLELHIDEPPAVIVDPQTRSALLLQTKRPQRRTRRRHDDATMDPSSHGDIMPGIGGAERQIWRGTRSEWAGVACSLAG